MEEMLARHRVNITGVPTRPDPLFPGLRLAGMRDLAISPDGAHLAFVAGIHFTLDKPEGQLWQADASGGVATALTAADVKGLSPAYSPNGQRLAFFCRDDIGQMQVCLIEIGQTKVRRLTEHHDTQGVLPTQAFESL